MSAFVTSIPPGPFGYLKVRTICGMQSTDNLQHAACSSAHLMLLSKYLKIPDLSPNTLNTAVGLSWGFWKKLNQKMPCKVNTDDFTLVVWSLETMVSSLVKWELGVGVFLFYLEVVLDDFEVWTVSFCVKQLLSDLKLFMTWNVLQLPVSLLLWKQCSVSKLKLHLLHHNHFLTFNQSKDYINYWRAIFTSSKGRKKP